MSSKKQPSESVRRRQMLEKREAKILRDEKAKRDKKEAKA